MATRNIPAQTISTFPFDETIDVSPYSNANPSNFPRAFASRAVYYQIIGDGRTYVFYGTGKMGVDFALFSVDTSKNPNNADAYTTVAGGGGRTRLSSTDPNYWIPSGALKVTLVFGTKYVLEVGAENALISGEPPLDPTINFHAEQLPAGTIDNATKATARAVVISTTQGTYKASDSYKAYNFGHTDADGNAGGFQLAWWSYVPVAAGSITIKGRVEPTNYYRGFLGAYRFANGTATLIASAVGQGEIALGPFNVAANEKILLAVGTDIYGPSFPNDYQGNQRYDFELTGGRTVTQTLPGTEVAPSFYIAGALPISTVPYDVHFANDNPTWINPEDPNWHLGYQGGNVAWFSHVGIGRTVTFYSVGSYQGVVLSLYEMTPSSTGGQPTYTRVAYSYNATAFGASDPAFFQPSTAIKYACIEGKKYYLQVGTASYDNPPGRGFGQDIYLHAEYTPAIEPDLRSAPQDIIITDAQGTYHSPALFNSGYTASVAQADDTALTNTNEVYQTAWWRYVPAASGAFTATAEVGTDNSKFGYLSAFRADSAGVLTRINQTSQAHTLTVTGSAAANETIYLQVGSLSNQVTIRDNLRYQLNLAGLKTVLQPDPGPVDTPDVPYDPTWDDPTKPAPDPYTPGKETVALDSGSDTLLNLVRAFSSQVKRAVRITGPSTIEMVNPAAPLPAGMTAASSSELYHSATRGSAATAGTLSLRYGDVTVSGSAELVNDDVQLVRSTWRIPDRLPFFGLPPAPVKRVTLTFSPHGFSASVDMHFPAVPLAARRS